jgi:hypothetical protein
MAMVEKELQACSATRDDCDAGTLFLVVLDARLRVFRIGIEIDPPRVRHAFPRSFTVGSAAADRRRRR